jgi:uncharacterized protein
MPLGPNIELTSMLASPWSALLLYGTLLGLLSGVLAGLLGIGGGIVLVPGITLIVETWFAFDHDRAVKTAIGTSLAVICFTSLSSLRAHARRDAVRWDLVRTLTPGILVGAVLAAAVAREVRGDWLVFAFSAFVLLSALRLLRGSAGRVEPARAESLPGTAGMAGAGIAIGSSAALVGAGGAFISVPFLQGCGIAIHRAVGTSAALGLPVAVSGSLAYVAAGWSLAAASGSAGSVGFVHLPSLAVLAVAGMLGAPLGARLAHGLSRRRLEQVFGVLLVLLATAMLGRALLR